MKKLLFSLWVILFPYLNLFSQNHTSSKQSINSEKDVKWMKFSFGMSSSRNLEEGKSLSTSLDKVDIYIDFSNPFPNTVGKLDIFYQSPTNNGRLEYQITDIGKVDSILTFELKSPGGYLYNAFLLYPEVDGKANTEEAQQVLQKQIFYMKDLESKEELWFTNSFNTPKP